MRGLTGDRPARRTIDVSRRGTSQLQPSSMYYTSSIPPTSLPSSLSASAFLASLQSSSALASTSCSSSSSSIRVAPSSSSSSRPLLSSLTLPAAAIAAAATALPLAPLAPAMAAPDRLPFPRSCGFMPGAVREWGNGVLGAPVVIKSKKNGGILWVRRRGGPPVGGRGVGADGNIGIEAVAAGGGHATSHPRSRRRRRFTDKPKKRATTPTTPSSPVSDTPSPTPDDMGCFCRWRRDTRDSNGLLVQCDSCCLWLHGTCLGYNEADDVPDQYICEPCQNGERGTYVTNNNAAVTLKSESKSTASTSATAATQRAKTATPSPSPSPTASSSASSTSPSPSPSPTAKQSHKKQPKKKATAAKKPAAAASASRTRRAVATAPSAFSASSTTPLPKHTPASASSKRHRSSSKKSNDDDADDEPAAVTSAKHKKARGTPAAATASQAISRVTASPGKSSMNTRRNSSGGVSSSSSSVPSSAADIAMMAQIRTAMVDIEDRLAQSAVHEQDEDVWATWRNRCHDANTVAELGKHAIWLKKQIHDDHFHTEWVARIGHAWIDNIRSAKSIGRIWELLQSLDMTGINWQLMQQTWRIENEKDGTISSPSGGDGSA